MDRSSTLKRKPSSVTSTNCKDSPVVRKPDKQVGKKPRSVSKEFTDGEEENQENMESLTPTVTTPEVLSKKLDSLATKAINLLGAEIE